MSVQWRTFKLKLLTQYCLIAGCIYTISSMGFIYAEEYVAKESLEENSLIAEFSNSALVGGIKDIDLSIYARGNPALVGLYPVNIYVNGVWAGERELEFKRILNTERVEHCFNLNELVLLNVDISNFKIKDKQQCTEISQWIPGATTRINTNTFRYDISIPQAFLKRTVRGYVPFQVWDRGINAGFLSYNLNTQQKHQNDEQYTNSYLSLNAGLNLAGWQFRHNAVTNKYQGEKTEYESLNTYAQKAFPQISSVLTLGESYSSGDLFDSFAFTGVQLRSEDRMLPETQTGYAPVIRGNAQTNAMVEVRQNNQLIYQTMVNPGAFIINDLYPTGFGGDLQVTVREANGQIQQFNVPYSSVLKLLRAGHHRYAITAGKVRQQGLIEKDYFLQATYQRGLNNYFTGYTGSLLSEHYQAYQLGTAVSTPIGAFAIDATHAVTESTAEQGSGPGKSTGQSYRISYQKSIPSTGTNFNLAASRYSTQGYYSFQEANLKQDLERRGTIRLDNSQQKSQLQMSLNQELGDRYGSFYLTGIWSEYWDDGKPQKDYQLGYNNNFKQLNYDVSVQRLKDANGNTDEHYFLTLMLPLEFKKRNFTVSQNISDFGNNSNITGSLTDDRALSFSASISDIGYKQNSANASVQYRSPYATAAVNTSIGRDYQQYGLNLTGTVLAHAHGVSFSPEMADTMVLVQANHAKGASIKNTTGLKIDRWGYAVIPYVTAYRMNQVSIDSRAVSDQVELMSTIQELAPYAGAIAKVEFKTKKGFGLLIKARKPNGEALPFAANVENSTGDNIGVVTQGSQILIRTEAFAAELLVKWGDSEDQQCRLNYQLDAVEQPTQGYKVIEEQCQ